MSKCFRNHVVDHLFWLETLTEMEEEAKIIARITVSDTVARINLGIVVSLSALVALTASFLLGLLVLTSYILGLALFYFLFKQRNALGNLLQIFIGETSTDDDKSHKATGCYVCGDGSCSRSKESHLHASHHDDIMINAELDESIESLLNRILKEFVDSWYSQISSDNAFELELRVLLRRACTILLQRGLKINLAEIIFQKLLPAGVRHLEDYLIIRETSQNQRIPFVRAAVQHLGTRLHPATLNRERELEYLRQLTECIMPCLATNTQLRCQNFSALVRELLAGWVLLPLADVLADPSILNSLLLLLLGHQQLTQYKDVNEPKVNFLKKFVGLPSKPSSAIHPDLSSILKEQKLLYPFMQFLKGEGAVNILQFCLDVEEFNRKMLTPDISSEEKDLLYKDAMDLYSVYFNPVSPDSIGLPSDIVENMKQVLTDDVGKLRTSPPLFQAYEHAYSILENKLCPLFHASDDFFRWLAGPRVLVTGVRSGNNSPLSQGSPARNRSNRKANENVGAVARISSRLHKIKGVLRGPVEGHTFDSDPGIDLVDPDFAEDMQLSDSTDRDLSAWRVSIPSVQTKLDASNKSYSVFYIDVQKVDGMKEVVEENEGNHWTVERRYTDFYALEAKLTEFHGEFTDNQLPSRRMLFFSAPNAQFLESRKQAFEEYIQKLLSKPSLRGSDLLYAFLRVPGEFSEMNSSPDALSRLLRRTVPLTLRKERGQHLEPFINIFFSSTEGKKISKLEYKDVSQESPPARDFRNIIGPVFRDNFSLTEEPALSSSNSDVPLLKSSLPSNDRLKGFTNSLIHIGVVAYNISQPSLRIAMSLQALVGQTLDAVVSYFVGRALKTLLVAPRLAHLIHLLQGAIFNSKSTHWNSMEIEERACRELDQLCTKFWLAKLAAPAFKGAFCAVQCPQLNKQLLYTLLDLIVEELFPEICHSC
ncbi:sorting nexin-14-like isoform X2 [Thrips palmi]|uniref:Sorting nexin-14-like isoform X2 n=1 Tax=Thrips palmi TaxID=161013 RepID=A0A6P8Z1H2_THRPL|nr:sorting nexin-14-like isoform X2 [Thrips palmi]